MQPMLHVQLVRNLVDCQMDPQESLDAPRWFLHGAGATQSEADMRYSSVLLEEGYGGRCDGQQVQPEQATRSQHLQQEHGDAPTAEGPLYWWVQWWSLSASKLHICRLIYRWCQEPARQYEPRFHFCRGG